MTGKERILVTGDRGCVGTALVETLAYRGYDVVGFDAGYYIDCLLEVVSTQYSQITRDIRDIGEEHLKGLHGIIHLAAFLNDPLGLIALFKKSGSTEEQFRGRTTIRLAELGRLMSDGRLDSILRWHHVQ